MAITRQDYKIIHNTLPGNSVESGESFQNLISPPNKSNVRSDSTWVTNTWNVLPNASTVKYGYASYRCELDWNTSYVLQVSDYIQTDYKNKISITNNNRNTNLSGGAIEKQGYFSDSGVWITSSSKLSSDIFPIDQVEELINEREYAVQVNFWKWVGMYNSYKKTSSVSINEALSYYKIKELMDGNATAVNFEIDPRDSANVVLRKQDFEFDNYIFFNTGPKNTNNDKKAKVSIDLYGILFNTKIENTSNEFLTSYYTTLKPKIYLFKINEAKMVVNNSLTGCISSLCTFEPFSRIRATRERTYDTFKYLFKLQPNIEVINKSGLTGIRIQTEELSDVEKSDWMALTEDEKQSNPYQLSLYRDHLEAHEQSVECLGNRRKFIYRYGILKYLCKKNVGGKQIKKFKVELLDNNRLGIELLWDPNIQTYFDKQEATKTSILKYLPHFGRNDYYESLHDVDFNFTSFAFNWFFLNSACGIITDPLIVDRSITDKNEIIIEKIRSSQYYHNQHYLITKKTT